LWISTAFPSFRERLMRIGLTALSEGQAQNREARTGSEGQHYLRQDVDYSVVRFCLGLCLRAVRDEFWSERNGRKYWSFRESGFVHRILTSLNGGTFALFFYPFTLEFHGRGGNRSTKD